MKVGIVSTSPTGRLAEILERTELFPAISPALRAVLGAGLSDTLVSTPTAIAEEASAIRVHKLAALAMRAAGPDAADDPALKPIVAQRLEMQMLTLRMGALAVESVGLLSDAGIETLVIKGPGIARWYEVPGLRPYRDVDLLVAPARFDEARRVLERAGGFRATDPPEPRAFVGRLCREAVNLTRADSAAVDLHQRIAPWRWGARLSFDRLFAASDAYAIGSSEVRVAGLEHSLLIAALHVVSDGNRAGLSLMPWRDVAELARRVDPARAALAARAVGLDWFLELVLRSMPAELTVGALVDEITGGEPSRSDAFRMRALLPPGVGSRLIAPAFRLPRSRAALYLLAYAFPGREFLGERYEEPNYGKWYREALGRARTAK